MNSHQAQVILSLAGFRITSHSVETGDISASREINGFTIIGLTVYSRSEPGKLIYASVCSYDSDELYNQQTSTPIRRVRLEHDKTESFVLEALKLAAHYQPELAVAS